VGNNQQLSSITPTAEDVFNRSNSQLLPDEKNADADADDGDTNRHGTVTDTPARHRRRVDTVGWLGVGVGVGDIGYSCR